MTELTLRDYLYLLGLTLVIVSVFLYVRSRRIKNKKFRSFLAGRILAEKALNDDPMNFKSRNEALEYVKIKVYVFREKYAAANGHGFMGSVSKTCNKLVDDLCAYRVIPESVYSTWR